MKKFIHQHIYAFEAGVVSMITIGFVILGAVLFTGLTPRQQTGVARAFDMFDIQEQTTAAMDNVKFIYNIPNEFYNQFYIAFTEVATVPTEAFDLPLRVIDHVAFGATVAINQLSDQVVNGYGQQNYLQNQKTQLSQLAYDGKVMGTMIDLSDHLANMTVINQTVEKPLDLHYEYSPPNFESLKLSLSKILKVEQEIK